MKQFSFEKLVVWQKSKDLSIHIYRITSSFPKEEKFGLISQLRRCAVSIASNLAEGSGRNSSKDKARFSEIAYGSLLELLNQSEHDVVAVLTQPDRPKGRGKKSLVSCSSP